MNFNKTYCVLVVIIFILIILVCSKRRNIINSKNVNSSENIKSLVTLERFNNNNNNINNINNNNPWKDSIVYKKDFKIKYLHRNPDIILVKNFMTPYECDYLIDLGEPHIKKSEVCGKGGSKPDKNRTSMTAHIGKMFLDNDKYDPVLANIRRKAGLFSSKNEKNVEPIQLVRYHPGQFFKSHYDYLDRNVDIYKENIEKNGQREFTFFVYLNNVPKENGGTTYFPKLSKHFQAGKGQAIFWSNMVNGEDDKRTLHSGTELFEGVKYGLNVWVREKEYIGGK